MLNRLAVCILIFSGCQAEKTDPLESAYNFATVLIRDSVAPGARFPSTREEVESGAVVEIGIDKYKITSHYRDNQDLRRDFTAVLRKSPSKVTLESFQPAE